MARRRWCPTILGLVFGFGLVCSAAAQTAWPCKLPSGVNAGKVGRSTDTVATPSGGLVLMGGGSDVDNAIRWMIERAGGGDVVVIRASGADGYNSYIYDMGGVSSVQTLVINSTREGDDACVAEHIRRAEMLFIAGGDQGDYERYWKGRAVGNAINYLINTKKAPVGGTSAGMAILGQYYHPGGAPSDSSVLQDPTAVTVNTGFVEAPLLTGVVTDTHFSQRGRQPRWVAFMASAIYNRSAGWQNLRGIACDEATAYAVEPNGAGRVFGSHSCFFAKPTGTPEVLQPRTPLTWNLGRQALSVYRVPGTSTGANTFNLGSYSGTGGAQQTWWVERGALTRQ